MHAVGQWHADLKWTANSRHPVIGNNRQRAMRHFLVACIVPLLSAFTVADEPIVKLTANRGRNRILSISSGRVTLSVPPRWSIAADGINSKQEDFESLAPSVRGRWRPKLMLKNVLRVEHLSDNSDRQSPNSELTLAIHANTPQKAAAEKMYAEFSDIPEMELLISPRIKSKTINAKNVLYFRLAFELVVEEHLFVQVGSDTFHFTASESIPYSLPSGNIKNLVGRIGFHSAESDEPPNTPKDRALGSDNGSSTLGDRHGSSAK